MMKTLHTAVLAKFARALLAVGVALIGLEAGRAAPGPASAEVSTKLGVDGARFTLNGKPTFLLGISYYAALGAPQEFVQRDLDAMEHHGFNWLRVWAMWDMFDHNISVVDADGAPRAVQLDKLKWLVAECDRRHLVVDVTLARGVGGVSTYAAHRRAVEVIVQALKPHRNWYIDLANECDVRDARYVPVSELKKLCALVHRLDPGRLVTASFGGHDVSKKDLRAALLTIRLDFVTPHRPRNAASPAQTEAYTRASLAIMRELGRVAPVHYQEPFRRGYGRWTPVAADFLTDLRGTRAGGAAGWCFHNGAQRGAPDKRPRRSFDMRRQRLFDQLDSEERKVVAAVASAAASDEKCNGSKPPES